MKNSRPAKVATLAEIAKQTGYSVTTVSLVLRDKPGFSSATVDAIKNAARDLGYSPNRFAGALRNKSSNVVGYLLPNSDEREEVKRWAVYDLTLLTEFVKAAEFAGYSVVAIPNSDINIANLNILSAIYAPDHTDDKKFEQLLESTNSALITYNYLGTSSRVLNLYFSFRQKGLEALEMLFNDGATKVATLSETRIADLLNNRPEFGELVGPYRDSTVHYGGDYRTFDAAKFLDQVESDGVDGIIAHLEVGHSIVEELNRRRGVSAYSPRLIVTVDRAYLDIDEGYLEAPELLGYLSFDSSAVFSTLFEELPEYLEDKKSSVIRLEFDVSITRIR